MKVAVCFSGFQRTLDQTYASINKHLIEPYQADCFVHTWNLKDLHLTDERLVEKKCFIDTFQENIKKIEIICPEKNLDKDRKIQNVLSMFYGIEKSFELKNKYEQDNNFKYDVVIRARMDMLLKEKVILEKNDSVNIPFFGDFGGINDQFAFGSSETMGIYSKLYSNILNLINEPGAFWHPEILLKKHLKNNNLAIKRFDLDYDLLCHNQVLNNKSRESNFSFLNYANKIGLNEDNWQWIDR